MSRKMRWLYNSGVVGDIDAVNQVGAKIFEYPSEIISSGHLQIDFAVIIFFQLTCHCWLGIVIPLWFKVYTMVALWFFHEQRNPRPKFRSKSCDLGFWGQVMHFDDYQRAKQLLTSEKKWQKLFFLKDITYRVGKMSHDFYGFLYLKESLKRNKFSNDLEVIKTAKCFNFGHTSEFF